MDAAKKYELTIIKQSFDLNCEITIQFPSVAKVRTTITPQVHIIADAKKVVDGDNKIALTTGTSGDIMSGDRLALVTANVSKMFTIDHVHND